MQAQQGECFFLQFICLCILVKLCLLIPCIDPASVFTYGRKFLQQGTKAICRCASFLLQRKMLMHAGPDLECAVLLQDPHLQTARQ